MVSGVGRSVWKIATKLGKTPQELKSIFTPLQWEWALFNYNEDIKEQSDLISTVFEALQPWLNPEVYAQMQKQKQRTESPAFVSLINELKGKGISQEDINAVLKDSGVSEEEFDKIEQVVSPWTNVKKEDLDG